MQLCREEDGLASKTDNNLDVETLKGIQQEDTAEEDEINEAFVMEEIGKIQSPFAQRACCPLRGTLSTHVKSLLVLYSHIPKEVLDGIMSYSHLWIIFSFHLNPRGKATVRACIFGKSKFTSTKNTAYIFSCQKRGRLGDTSTPSTQSLRVVFGIIGRCCHPATEWKKTNIFGLTRLGSSLLSMMSSHMFRGIASITQPRQAMILAMLIYIQK